MEIERNIPVPEKAKSGAPAKHPFSKMNIGDSVLMGNLKMQTYCHVYGNQAGMKFVTRKQPCGGVRIWRTA